MGLGREQHAYILHTVCVLLLLFVVCLVVVVVVVVVVYRTVTYPRG